MRAGDEDVEVKYIPRLFTEDFRRARNERYGARAAWKNNAYLAYAYICLCAGDDIDETRDMLPKSLHNEYEQIVAKAAKMRRGVKNAKGAKKCAKTAQSPRNHRDSTVQSQRNHGATTHQSEHLPAETQNLPPTPYESKAKAESDKTQAEAKADADAAVKRRAAPQKDPLPMPWDGET